MEPLRLRQLITALLALLAIAGGAIVYLHDPASTWWMPKCAFHAITGLDCPSCGSTRALHALLHGHFADALACNAFIVLSWPIAIAVVAAWAFRPRALHSPAMIWLIRLYAAAFLIWWMVRNLL